MTKADQDSPARCVHATEKRCELPSCRLPFTPAKPWQRFCSTTCHDAFWRAMRPTDAKLDQFLKIEVGPQWMDKFWKWRLEHE